MRTLKIKPKALKALGAIDKQNRMRIVNKLEYYASLPTPQIHASALVDFEYWTYRFRIGKYRAIVDFDNKWRMIIVALIGHRKDIYKL